MNTKILIGGVIGGITMFLAGWLVYGVILSSVFPMPENPKLSMTMMMVWIFLSNLSGGLLLAYIFDKWANISTPKSGIMAGMMLGFLIALMMDCFMMTLPEPYTGVMFVADVIAGTVLTACAGATIGWYYGRGAAA